MPANSTATVKIKASAGNSNRTVNDVLLKKGDSTIDEKTGRTSVVNNEGNEFEFDNLTAGTYIFASTGSSYGIRFISASVTVTTN